MPPPTPTVGGRKTLLFGKKYQAPHKRRKSCLCGARLATFSDKSRRRARISGKGRWDQRRRGSLPLPRQPRGSLPPPRRYLCRRSDGGFSSRAGSGPCRSPCRPARRDYLLSVRVFLRVQVAVSPPSMLNSDRRNSGSRRPREDPAPLIRQGGCGRSASGLGAGTTGEAQSHERGAGEHRAPGRP